MQQDFKKFRRFTSTTARFSSTVVPGDHEKSEEKDISLSVVGRTICSSSVLEQLFDSFRLLRDVYDTRQTFFY